MSTERNPDRTVILLFAIAATVAAFAAFVTTFERIGSITRSDSLSGTTGLASPRQPLDRAPGEPVVRK